MKEGAEEVTQLTGYGHEAFSALLEYVYTDDIPDIAPDVAIELLMLANEYLLGKLKVSLNS
jgi:hypothetical protein